MANKLSPSVNKAFQKNNTGYQWKDKDPVVDLLREAIRFATEELGLSLAQIAASAMCSYQTIARIDAGVTRKPLNTTCDRIFEACGFNRPVVRMTLDALGGELNYDQAIALLHKIVHEDMTKAQIIALIVKSLKLKPKPVE